MVFGEPELRLRAQHPLGGLTAQLGLLDFEITGQDRTHHRKWHLHAFTDIRGATDHLNLGCAITDLTYPQLVCIRMGLYRLDFTNDHATKLAGHRLETIHLQTGHGDLVHQFLGIDLRIYPLAQPLFTEFHGYCLVLMRLCLFG